LTTGNLESVDESGECDAARALNVVVVAADLVAVAGEQSDRIGVPVQSSKWMQQFGKTS